MNQSKVKNVNGLSLYNLKQYFSRGMGFVGSYIDWWRFYHEVFGYSDFRAMRKLIVEFPKSSTEIRKPQGGLWWVHVPTRMTTKLVLDTAKARCFPIHFLIDDTIRKVLLGVDFQRRACGYSFAIASTFETATGKPWAAAATKVNEFGTLTIGEYVLLAMFWDWKLKQANNKIHDCFHIEEDDRIDCCKKTICHRVSINNDVIPIIYNSPIGMIVTYFEKPEDMRKVEKDPIRYSDFYTMCEPAPSNIEVCGPREIVCISNVIYKGDGHRLV
jgi:hypothetical protein